MSGRQFQASAAARPANPMSITAMLNGSEDNVQDEQASHTDRRHSQADWSDPTYWHRQRRDRGPVDEQSPTDSDASREKRDSYNEEQKNFIYYHRLVLGRSWERIEKDFEDRFGQRRSKSGLQCRFYRVLSERGSGKVRNQGRIDKHYKLDAGVSTSGSGHGTGYRS